jgi:hypothetical protein
MKKIIKYISSLFFIFLLFPMSVFAGEVVKVECTNDKGPFTLNINSDGGKQEIFSIMFNVAVSKDAIFGADDYGRGFFINFGTGEFYSSANKFADCKFPNIEVLENNNTVDDVTEVKEVEIIEATCDAGMEVALFFIRNDGGTQYVDFFEENAEITFTQDKVLMRLESSGLMVIDFKSGDLFLGGEKKADCEFSNLEALN